MTMLAMTWDHAVLLIWAGTAAVSFLAAMAMLAWAIKTGQFKDQQHAARLPLESGRIHTNTGQRGEQSKGRGDV